jgi:D-arabinose 1-dehydrogenase-like Zn-dependent alcohol dehydrogenase
MSKPKHNNVLTIPEPGKVEFVNRPYPRVKSGSVIVKTEIAAVCVDDRVYTGRR